jgi:hypothetical protein
VSRAADLVSVPSAQNTTEQGHGISIAARGLFILKEHRETIQLKGHIMAVTATPDAWSSVRGVGG